MNENTRRNINLRGLLDVSGETERDSTVIDINKDYFIDKSEIDDKKEPNIEMIHQETVESKILSSTTIKDNWKGYFISLLSFLL